MPSISKDFAYLKKELTNIKNYDDFLVWTHHNLQPLIPHYLIIQLNHHLTNDSIEVTLQIPQKHCTSIKHHENKLLFQRIINLFEAVQKNCLSLKLAHICETKKISEKKLLKNAREITAFRFFNASKHSYQYYLFVSFCTITSAPDIDVLIKLIPLIGEIHNLLIEKIHLSTPWIQRKTTFNSKLTPAERKIMEWVKLGKTNSEIGQILGISTYTAKNHLANIFKKLNVVSRAQAVAEQSSKDI